MEFQCAGQKPKIYFALPKKKKKKGQKQKTTPLDTVCWRGLRPYGSLVEKGCGVGWSGLEGWPTSCRDGQLRLIKSFSQ